MNSELFLQNWLITENFTTDFLDLLQIDILIFDDKITLSLLTLC